MLKKRKRRKLFTEVIDPFINQPKGTEDMVFIEDVKIPPDFAVTKTSSNKINRYSWVYEKMGHLDKPISVIAEINEKGKHNKLLLVNEYSRYIIAVNKGVKKVPVKYIDINTYCAQNE